MPSSSPAQASLMGAIAYGWKPPASSGISVPIGVAKEFNEADKRKALANGLRKPYKPATGGVRG